MKWTVISIVAVLALSGCKMAVEIGQGIDTAAKIVEDANAATPESLLVQYFALTPTQQEVIAQKMGLVKITAQTIEERKADPMFWTTLGLAILTTLTGTAAYQKDKQLKQI